MLMVCTGLYINTGKNIVVTLQFNIMPIHAVLVSTRFPLDHWLVMWLNENSVSIVPLSKIIIPLSAKVIAGSSCTVKGFEGFSSWVVAIGTKKEIMGWRKNSLQVLAPKTSQK